MLEKGNLPHLMLSSSCKNKRGCGLSYNENSFLILGKFPGGKVFLVLRYYRVLGTEQLVQPR